MKKILQKSGQLQLSLEEIDHKGKNEGIGKIHIFFGVQMITHIITLIFPIAVNMESVQL